MRGAARAAGLCRAGHPTERFRGAQGISWGKKNFLRAVTSKEDWWGIAGGIPWSLLMSPLASICFLSMMEMGSRGGAPGAEVELSNQETPCFLNTLDTPCQEDTPALLACATPTEHLSPWAAASYAGQAHFGCSMNNNSEPGMAVS